jgi:transposase
VVSAELVAPAPCGNDPEPVCEGMSEVVAELLDSSGMSNYRIAKITGLSKEEIRKLRRRKGGIGMKSAVIIGRAFFFSYTELAALAEECARRGWEIT